MIIFTGFDKDNVLRNQNKYLNESTKINPYFANGMCVLTGDGTFILDDETSIAKFLSENNANISILSGEIYAEFEFWTSIKNAKHVFGDMEDSEIVALIVSAMNDDKMSGGILNEFYDDTGVQLGDAIIKIIEDSIKGVDGELTGGTGASKERGGILAKVARDKLKIMSIKTLKIENLFINLKYLTHELFTGHSFISVSDRNGDKLTTRIIMNEDEAVNALPEEMADPLFLANMASDDIVVSVPAMYKKPKQKVFLAVDTSGSMGGGHDIVALAYVLEFTKRLKEDLCELYFGWHGVNFYGFKKIEKNEVDKFVDSCVARDFNDGTSYNTSIPDAMKEIKMITGGDENTIKELVFIGDGEDEIDLTEISKQIYGSIFNYIHVSSDTRSLSKLEALCRSTGGTCIKHNFRRG